MMFCVAHFTCFVKQAMYTSNVNSSPHTLSTFYQWYYYKLKKREKGLKEVAKINKNLHAVGLCDRGGFVVLWEQKANTVCYSSFKWQVNHAVKKRYIYVQNKLVLFIQNAWFNMPHGRFIIWADFTYVVHQLQLQTDYYIQIIIVVYYPFSFLKPLLNMIKTSLQTMVNTAIQNPLIT